MFTFPLRVTRCPRRTFGLALTLLPLLGACRSGEDDAAHAPVGGTLVISSVADADLLLPPVALTGTALQVVDAVFERLLQPSIDSSGALTLAPGLATRWSYTSDSTAVDFTLDEKAHWHDGTPVTASDVRFTFDAYRDSTVGSPSRDVLQNIDSVQIRDAHTVRFWFAARDRRALERSGTELRILPQHLLDKVPRTDWRTSDYARSPVGSGRFRFVSWQAGGRIEVEADTGNHRGRPRLDRVVWSIAPDPAAAILRLRTGDADFLENVRPDAVPELAAVPDVKVVRSAGLAYGYLQWNLLAPRRNDVPHPVLGDRQVRVALAHAIDREAVVRMVFDSLARVALGPLTRLQLAAMSAADRQLPALAFDTAVASRLLDSTGWSRNGNGIRMRNGRPLSFTILVPASSTPRVRLATLMLPMFKAIGVDARLESLEFPAFMGRLAAGDFDAAVMAIGADIDPSGISGVWGSGAARPNGGPNFGSYRSAPFDAAVARASATINPHDAQQAMLEAYRIILDDAPALWLFEPYTVSAMRRDITPVGIRPDAWWSQLADWSRTPAPAMR